MMTYGYESGCIHRAGTQARQRTSDDKQKKGLILSCFSITIIGLLLRQQYTLLADAEHGGRQRTNSNETAGMQTIRKKRIVASFLATIWLIAYSLLVVHISIGHPYKCGDCRSSSLLGASSCLLNRTDAASLTSSTSISARHHSECEICALQHRLDVPRASNPPISGDALAEWIVPVKPANIAFGNLLVSYRLRAPPSTS